MKYSNSGLYVTVAGKSCESCVGRLTVSNYILINSLPNDIILNLSKLKAFADDKLNVTQKLKFTLGRVDNIVRKGENAGHLFSKAYFLTGR